MALTGYRRGEKVGNEWQGEAELLANAIDPRYYGEDEFRKRIQDTGDEQSMGN